MIKFSKDKVLLLHKLIAEETGGSIGVRDKALLESALENAFSGFGGQEFYPSKEEKGARLGYTLISNHAFVDGNKRITSVVIESAEELIDHLLFEYAVDIMEDGGHTCDPTEASKIERAEIEHKLAPFMEQLPMYRDRLERVFVSD